jgi:hypothetical protein
MNPNQYEECWMMKLSTIESVRSALTAGLENTQELLINHDIALGRTTRGNRYTAERLEGEIRDMKACLELLEKPDGVPFDTE